MTLCFLQCGHKFSGRRLTERVDDASCRFVDDCPVLGDDAIEQCDLGGTQPGGGRPVGQLPVRAGGQRPHAFERGHGRRFHAAMVAIVHRSRSQTRCIARAASITRSKVRARFVVTEPIPAQKSMSGTNVR